MADGDLFGWEENDARRIADAVSFVEHNPRYQLKKRRYPVAVSSSGGDSSGGGGDGGGGCACCDCTECLNICAQDKDSVITTCSACQVAPNKYAVDFGSVLGVQDFIHTTGCVWETANFTIYYIYPTGGGGSTAGVYKGTLTQDGTDSTLVITFVSGTDTLKLSTHRKLQWKADPDKEWSCICNAAMIPSVEPQRFPPNAGIRCEICVKPADSPPTAALCPYLDERGWCLSTVAFGAIDFSASGGLTSCPCPELVAWPMIHPLPSEIPDEGLCCVHAQGGNITGPQPNYVPYIAYACTTEGYSHQYVLACVNVSTGVIGARVEIHQGYVEDVFIFEGVYIGTGAITLGVNVLNFVSSTAGMTTGGGAITDVTWPSTITFNVTECTYGADHPDTGYGCGNSGGCTGCTWHAVSSGGGWAWAVTTSDCSGCVSPYFDGCSSPVIDATEGATTTGPCGSL